MEYQTEFANSMNWLNENIAFSFSSFWEPVAGTADLANFPFIYKPLINIPNHPQIEDKEAAIQLSTGLEMELKAWDKLSDEAFIILENSV